MFYYLSGEIALLKENLAVVDCGGVVTVPYCSRVSALCRASSRPKPVVA